MKKDDSNFFYMVSLTRSHMRPRSVLGIVALFLLASTLVLPMFAQVVDARPGNYGGNGSSGNTAAAQSSVLSEVEVYWLNYMREEEKLARDVYKHMYDLWGSRIFKNIAASEQRHMDSIKTLLDRYGIPDPAAGKGYGEFTNEHIQELYDSLIAKGTISLKNAFEVGVMIEVLDIEDLEHAIATTTHKDIKNVYTNLLEGSYNHLAAFETQLAKY